MSLALVLKHLESQRWLIRIAEVLLQVLTIQMVDAGFETDRALFQYPELLVAHRHVVEKLQSDVLVSLTS